MPTALAPPIHHPALDDESARRTALSARTSVRDGDRVGVAAGGVPPVPPAGIVRPAEVGVALGTGAAEVPPDTDVVAPDFGFAVVGAALVVGAVGVDATKGTGVNDSLFSLAWPCAPIVITPHRAVRQST